MYIHTHAQGVFINGDHNNYYSIGNDLIIVRANPSCDTTAEYVVHAPV